MGGSGYINYHKLLSFFRDHEEITCAPALMVSHRTCSRKCQLADKFMTIPPFLLYDEYILDKYFDSIRYKIFHQRREIKGEKKKLQQFAW